MATGYFDMRFKYNSIYLIQMFLEKNAYILQHYDASEGKRKNHKH